MIEIKNCVFNMQDEAATLKKCSTHGVEVKGDEEVLIENCSFENRGYSAIHACGTGALTVKDCKFACDNLYNPIEGGQSGAGNSVVNIYSNEFVGKCGNNYVNFYRFQDGAKINLANNTFEGVDPEASEILRISNMTSANVTYNVNGDAYQYINDKVGDYTAYIMCQDYTNKNGVKQDFTKVTVNMDGVKCNGEVITADHIAQGKVTFTYEDGVGIIEDNDPVINFK